MQTYKIDIVKRLKERLDGAKAIVVVDYKGINIEEVNQLRSRYRANNVDYFVAKNTFIKIALNELGITELDEYLVGPTAVAVCKEDEVAPARETVKFIKEVMEDKAFPRFKAGYVDGSIMNVDELEQLAKLPTKEELIAKVMYGFNAPITGFVGVMSGILRKFAYALNALAENKAE
ncbi:MAG: 50S ribosomal protein L10 [Candidatus Cloacimonadota bacterium]|nr:MAG: 50S ribosomal protein L10 [Candidatus Cloacimonadota bacterium]